MKKTSWLLITLYAALVLSVIGYNSLMELYNPGVLAIIAAKNDIQLYRTSVLLYTGGFFATVFWIVVIEMCGELDICKEDE